jgi:putative membrane-bound dehydrogenase-like protein
MTRRPRMFLRLAVAAMTTVIAIAGFSSAPFAAESKPKPVERQALVGVAKIDVTPTEPIRLTGYSSRKTPSEGVAGKLFVNALAVCDASDPSGSGRAVWITVDNCAIPGTLTDTVWRKLKAKYPINRERLAISVTHTHSAPRLRGALPTMFMADLPAAEEAAVDRYTDRLIDAMVEAAASAIASAKPNQLWWGQGKGNFAHNRRSSVKDKQFAGSGRTENGPVDDDLPMLLVGSPEKPDAVLVSYACHCTTIGGKFNQVHGDWAGSAKRIVEERHPGAVALIAIGCGADSNPAERDGDQQLALCDKHGTNVADEVDKLLKSQLKPVRLPLECHLEKIDLPFDKEKLPTKQQLEAMAKGGKGITAGAQYHAQKDLQRLERGEPQRLWLTEYPVQSWAFGRDLAIVFLGGEVVVDYSRRLKDMFDREKFWVNGYSNAVPCYIPSRRILAEGGYEAETSMHYYDQPGRLSPEIEDQIVDTVQKVVPRRFLAERLRADFPEAKSPEDSLAAISVHQSMKVELVAAEPLIQDPIAFDWGPDGKLWVVEMRDYPNGMDGQGKPGGRIIVLEDTKGTGKYDKSTVFMDNISFPTGIKVWRNGVLVTAAPEVFYAEDLDGDGKADVKKVLYSGFGEENQQHRVNGLRWGLDNWLYIGSGSGGGGTVRSALTGETLEMSRRDLRISPDDGRIDAQSGHTQYGRERDDWGNWFGGNNSRPMWHYALDDRYLRRNKYVTYGPTWVDMGEVPGAGPVYPSSRTLERFNSPNSINHFTSACSPLIYRDDVLGENFNHMWLACEPVHNLVHREAFEDDGASFKSHRVPEEKESEFFRSADNWTRPAMVRVGPDGALYVADMYRFVIEHPKWIPQEWLRKLDVREGEDKGRIYRISPKDRPLRKVPRLDRMSNAELVQQLDTASGFIRDLVQQMLLWSGDKSVVPALEKLAIECKRPETRLQAMCTLDGLNALSHDVVAKGLVDEHPGVRRNAVRLAETRFDHWPDMAQAVANMITDQDAKVRQQVSYSLGEWSDPRAGAALGALMKSDDKLITAAVLSSATKYPDEILKASLASSVAPAYIEQLLSTAVGAKNAAAIDVYWTYLTGLKGNARVPALVRLIDASDLQGVSVGKVVGEKRAAELRPIFDSARKTAADSKASVGDRRVAVSLLGRGVDKRAEDIELLSSFITADKPLELQAAAVNQLTKIRDKSAPTVLLDRWAAASPQVRDQILDTLISRANWVGALLDRMEKQPEIVQALGTSRKETLLRSRSGNVAERAAKLLGGGTNPDRQRVVAEYVKSMNGLSGDAKHGAEMFTNICAVCHKVGNIGREIGPDLTALADKPMDQLVLAILDPNSAVEARFVNYIATLRDGQTLMGLIKFETGSSITLVGLNGLDNVILRSDIKSLVSTGRSLMPEGFEGALKPQDIADVIAFLRQSAKRTTAAK